MHRSRKGKTFSIVAVAEGAVNIEMHKKIKAIEDKLDNTKDKKERGELKEKLAKLSKENSNHTISLAKQLEDLTRLEIC